MSLDPRILISGALISIVASYRLPNCFELKLLYQKCSKKWPGKKGPSATAQIVQRINYENSDPLFLGTDKKIRENQTIVTLPFYHRLSNVYLDIGYGFSGQMARGNGS